MIREILKDESRLLGKRTNNMHKKQRSLKAVHTRSRGQSLVELAIVLAVLMFMLVGIVEYGFLLNKYLNLVDATREAARFGSNVNPFDEFNNVDMNFFVRPDTSQPVDAVTNPAGLSDLVEDFVRPLVLNPAATDDIVISFFSVDGDGDVLRFPTTMPNGYSRFGQKNSRFSDAEITARLDASAPATGVLLVEIFYNYPQTLNLPVFSNLVPNPIPVYTYAIMPLSAAEPTSTPSP